MPFRKLVRAQTNLFVTAGATLAANEEDHQNWCDDLATKLLCVFALDRFGDYVSDQVCFPFLLEYQD